jgi:hypothetical protein
LAEHPHKYFADQAAWAAHLDGLGVSALKVNPDPVMVATVNGGQDRYRMRRRVSRLPGLTVGVVMDRV